MPRCALKRRHDLRRNLNEAREDEPPGADLDDRNVVLAEILLEWQVGVSGEQYVEAGCDGCAKQLAVRHALPTALADMLGLVRREITRQVNGEVLIEEHTHLGRSGDAGFRLFEDL